MCKYLAQVVLTAGAVVVGVELGHQAIEGAKRVGAWARTKFNPCKKEA